MAIPLVYLAGPDVFFPEARAFSGRKVELCRAAGFEPLAPFENDESLEATLASLHGAAAAQFLFEQNEGMMRRADIILANLTPWHGASADVGTVFELGFMAALGKRCFGYSNDGRDFAERAAAFAVDGTRVEQHGLADNLMIDRALKGNFVRGKKKPSDADYYSDLTAFKEALGLI